jgi:hypothetical protein
MTFPNPAAGPWDSHNQMMIGNIQKTIENLVGPNVSSMLSTCRAEATFTEMRDKFHMTTIFTLVDMET